VANSRTAPRRSNKGAGAAGAPPVEKRPAPQSSTLSDLDTVIHERIRLGIVSALAANECLSFVDLKGILRATDGNISAHTRKLEDAGYIRSNKRFEGRVPRTEYELTPAGRKALERYLERMEGLIRSMRHA
jgi:DNA-binding MarR family transcriptional regulator